MRIFLLYGETLLGKNEPTPSGFKNLVDTPQEQNRHCRNGTTHNQPAEYCHKLPYLFHPFGCGDEHATEDHK